MSKLLLDKLKDVWEKHDQIIVGVDFDDTIFPWDDNEDNQQRCNRVIAALISLKKKAKVGAVICLYTVADKRSLVYKEHIMKLYKISPNYVNAGPLDNKWGDTRKPFFNILLDDKAGLDEKLETLEEFIDWL